MNQPPVAVADSVTSTCTFVIYAYPIENDTDPENNTPLHLVGIDSSVSGGLATASIEIDGSMQRVMISASAVGTYVFPHRVGQPWGHQHWNNHSKRYGWKVQSNPVGPTGW